MTAAPVVVKFPKQNVGPKSDGEIASDIHKAQRRLIRALQAAHDLGLHIRMGKDINQPIQVSRIWKGKK